MRILGAHKSQETTAVKEEQAETKIQTYDVIVIPSRRHSSARLLLLELNKDVPLSRGMFLRGTQSLRQHNCLTIRQLQCVSNAVLLDVSLDELRQQEQLDNSTAGHVPTSRRVSPSGCGL